MRTLFFPLRFKIFECLLVSSIYFLFVFLLIPFSQIFQLNTDEGIELSKILLVNQGYSIYDQIWNDQPPLLTYLLSGWFQIFGRTIFAARSLILCFSSILVGTFYFLLRRSLSSIFSIVGTFGLCLTHNFLFLSVSVLRGLPAVSFLLLSIAFLLTALNLKEDQENPVISQESIDKYLSNLTNAHLKKFYNLKSIYLVVISGICIGISLQFKLFTVILVPPCILYIFLVRHRLKALSGSSGIYLKIIALWMTSLIICLIFGLFLSNATDYNQIFLSHFNPEMKMAVSAVLDPFESKLKLLLFLVQDLDYTILAFMLIWLSFKSKSPFPLFPALWLLFVIPILLVYEPIWSHYSLLISIPLTWLAIHGLKKIKLSIFSESVDRSSLNKVSVRQYYSSSVSLSISVFIVLALAAKIYVFHQNYYYFAREYDSWNPIYNQILKYKAKTTWIFTDLPIVSFYADLKIPPESVVFSVKRVNSGGLNHLAILNLMQKYQPEQILLGRFPEIENSLQPYLMKYYTKNCRRKLMNHYVKKTFLSVSNKSLC